MDTEYCGYKYFLKKKYCASTDAHGVYALLWIMFVKVANIVFLSIKKCD